VSSLMREKSSCRNVGASDGGTETTPLIMSLPRHPRADFARLVRFYLFVRPDAAVVHNVAAVPLRFIALLEHNRLPCFEACDYN
jgi:hypothetical protein